MVQMNYSIFELQMTFVTGPKLNNLQPRIFTILDNINDNIRFWCKIFHTIFVLGLFILVGKQNFAYPKELINTGLGTNFNLDFGLGKEPIFHH